MKELATLSDKQLKALYDDLIAYEEEIRSIATIDTMTEVSRRIHKVESELDHRSARSEY